MIIAGIDNGVSGGVVLLSPLGQIVAKTTMPTQKHKKRNEIDIRKLWEWLTEHVPNRDFVAIVEEPGGSKSAKAATSMAGSFHSIRGMLEVKQVEWHRITPQSWQNALLPERKSGETKQAALRLANQLWPDEDWRRNERCKVAHDGIVDSALIAWHWLNKNKT